MFSKAYNLVDTFYSLQLPVELTKTPLKFYLNYGHHLFIYFNGNTIFWLYKNINKQEDGCSQNKLRFYELLVGIDLAWSHMISFWGF